MFTLGIAVVLATASWALAAGALAATKLHSIAPSLDASTV